MHHAIWQILSLAERGDTALALTKTGDFLSVAKRNHIDINESEFTFLAMLIILEHLENFRFGPAISFLDVVQRILQRFPMAETNPINSGAEAVYSLHEDYLDGEVSKKPFDINWIIFNPNYLEFYSLFLDHIDLIKKCET